MSKKNIILTAVMIIIFLLILVAAGAIYYFQTREINAPLPETKKDAEELGILSQERMREIYNQRFPDVIEGMIDIVSDSETIVKTEEKEYLIWPARPAAFYRDSGIENNTMVQVRGKITDNNRISLGSVVPGQ